MYFYSSQLLGCALYGANKNDFSDSVKLHTLTKCYDLLKEIKIDSTYPEFRYFLFKGINKQMHIYEIIFLMKKMKKLQGS